MRLLLTPLIRALPTSRIVGKLRARLFGIALRPIRIAHPHKLFKCLLKMRQILVPVTPSSISEAVVFIMIADRYNWILIEILRFLHKILALEFDHLSFCLLLRQTLPWKVGDETQVTNDDVTKRIQHGFVSACGRDYQVSVRLGPELVASTFELQVSCPLVLFSNSYIGEAQVASLLVSAEPNWLEHWMSDRTQASWSRIGHLWPALIWFGAIHARIP